MGGAVVSTHAGGCEVQGVGADQWRQCDQVGADEARGAEYGAGDRAYVGEDALMEWVYTQQFTFTVDEVNHDLMALLMPGYWEWLLMRPDLDRWENEGGYCAEETA